MPTSTILTRTMPRRLGVVVLAIAALLAAALPASAQRADADGPSTIRVFDRVRFDTLKPQWRDCGLRKDPKPVQTPVQELPEHVKARAKSTQTVDIQVTYGSGFTFEARQAFERAVEVWEQHITSPVTIRVQATFSDLGPGVLGGAGPRFVYSADTDGDGASDTVFGDALIDALTGQDQTPDSPDIIARFSSARDDWHFGEGDAPVGTIDFTSVVLHEIGHGLNYFDLFNFVDGEGLYGDLNGDGSITQNEGSPGIFDTFLVEDTGSRLVRLVNEEEFPNPSVRLGSALTSNSLFFDSEQGRRAAEVSTGPVPPKMYAPTGWRSGSSIAHLDELTYRPGDPNALMSPSFNSGETARLPGPIVCGQMADMGWELATGCTRFFRDVFAFQVQSADDAGAVSLRWEVTEDAAIDTFFVERQRFDGPFEVVRTLAGDAPPQVTLRDLGLGVFTFRLRWVAADGREATTFEQPTITLNVDAITADVVDTGPEGRGVVDVAWDVPPGTQGFRYAVETAPGTAGVREEDFSRAAADVTETEARLERQTPGRYTYRIVATDAQGNALTSETQTLEIDFQGTVFALGPYPNPARSQTVLDLTTSRGQEIDIEVFDRLGRRLYEETRRVSSRAPEQVRINTSPWASGMYFLRIAGNDFREMRRLVVVK
jgi:hypothetical protein